MKIKYIFIIVLLIVNSFIEVVTKSVAIRSVIDKTSESDNWGPPETGGINYFHISSTNEFGVVRKITPVENDKLQKSCGYVKKNHLEEDEIPEDENIKMLSKRNIFNGTDFEGRGGFNAIAYAKGKVPEGAVPWAVGIGMKNSVSCTGSIISPYHVLTAAHCLFKYKVATVRCIGEKRINLFSDTRVYYGGTCLKKSVDNLCKKTTVKEKRIRRASYNYVYNINNCGYGSDVAIIEVESPFEFDELTQPICLPSPIFDVTVEMDPKEIIHSIGFGKTELNMTSVYLRRGKNLICKNTTDSYNSRYVFSNAILCMRSCNINDNLDCLGYDNMRTGICKGDSGGPDYIRMNNVTNPTDQRYMIIGIHSSGSECTPKELKEKVYHNSVKVSHHVKEICWLTGVCPQNKKTNL
uniref:Peptidase S1 domain-containing protein n=1 Tax=Strongyloides stercoralis TaxID=6248 RepID=A0A0K0E343_STRER